MFPEQMGISMFPMRHLTQETQTHRPSLVEKTHFRHRPLTSPPGYPNNPQAYLKQVCLAGYGSTDQSLGEDMHQCQWAKVHTHTHGLPCSNWRFQNIHIDIVGPLPEVRGYSGVQNKRDKCCLNQKVVAEGKSTVTPLSF